MSLKKELTINFPAIDGSANELTFVENGDRLSFLINKTLVFEGHKESLTIQDLLRETSDNLKIMANEILRNWKPNLDNLKFR